MNVEELKQKALAATPGPWFDAVSSNMNNSVHVSMGIICNTGKNIDDAAFIAAANPAAILELIAELDELAAKLDRAQAEIRVLESKLLDATAKPIRICESCAIYPCKCE